MIKIRRLNLGRQQGSCAFDLRFTRFTARPCFEVFILCCPISGFSNVVSLRLDYWEMDPPAGAAPAGFLYRRNPQAAAWRRKWQQGRIYCRSRKNWLGLAMEAGYGLAAS